MKYHKYKIAAVVLLASLLLSGVVMAGAGQYVVQSGDTLWAISRRFGVSVEVLASQSGIEDPAVIYPGQVIMLGDQVHPRISKIGDSLSADVGFLSDPAQLPSYEAWGLGRSSLAVRAGWGAEALDKRAGGGVCGAVPPVRCELRRNQPQVVVVLVGTNDARQGTPPAQFSEYLSAIVMDVFAGQAEPVLTTLPSLAGPSRELIPAYNDVIRGVAGLYNLTMVDWGSKMDGLPNAGLGPDGVHPTPEGYRLRNELTVAALEELARRICFTSC